MKTAILSNGSPKMLQAAAENAGIAESLDAIISVDELGIFKPHPSVYQLGVDKLGVLAREICFVSANAWDVAGSASFGFQVAHLNRSAQPSERLPGKPKAILTSLSELPPIIS